MSLETVIDSLCMGDLTVKVRHFQMQTTSVNFKTNRGVTKRTDHYEWIYEQEDRGERKEEKVRIPKRLYNALIAFESDK
ncbi:hypothetical protein FQV37_2248 [Psychrobacter nivimaris]|uniref:Uncharacterized protein n=1 Tax=Psychrobacter nivimaris TaxID=281738 RepID=A0A6N7BWI0_9GAMM|nr:hypothetical protein [Psychrobacter nivimaris]KAF0567392.1 hypothetical protein FQV37_2248 [Psychrobacter nivimaris]